MTTRYVNTSSSGGDGTTNGESGATAAYASWASFITNEYPVTASDAWVVNMDSGSSNNADTAAANMAGFTGSSTNTITFQPNAGQEHSGIYNTNIYRHEYTASSPIDVADSYTTVYGIQSKNNRTGAGTKKEGFKSVSAITESYFINCISVLGISTTNTLGCNPFLLNNSSMTLCGVINCLAFNWITGTGTGGIEVRSNSASPNQNFAYNNTVVDGTEGYRARGGNALFKNNLAFNNTTNWNNSAGADTTNSTNNASDDSTSTIFGSNSVDLSSYTGAQIFNNYSGDDFTLGGGTGSDQIDTAGADLDADSYYAVTEDFIGTSRHATTPSIGCHEYVALDVTINVPVGALGLTAFVPIIQTGGDVSVNVPVGSLTLESSAPIPLTHVSINIPVASLGLSGLLPAVDITNHQNVDVPTGSVGLNGFAPAPITNVTVNIPVGDLTLAGIAPVITTGGNVAVEIPVASLSLTGQNPTIVNHNTINIPTATLTISGYSPTVGNHVSIDVPVGNLTADGFAPVVDITGNQTIDIPLGNMALTGFDPTVSSTNHQAIDIPAGVLTLTGFAPVAAGTVLVGKITGSIKLEPVISGSITITKTIDGSVALSRVISGEETIN